MVRSKTGKAARGERRGSHHGIGVAVGKGWGESLCHGLLCSSLEFLAQARSCQFWLIFQTQSVGTRFLTMIGSRSLIMQQSDVFKDTNSGGGRLGGSLSYASDSRSQLSSGSQDCGFKPYVRVHAGRGNYLKKLKRIIIIKKKPKLLIVGTRVPSIHSFTHTHKKYLWSLSAVPTFLWTEWIQQ